METDEPPPNSNATFYLDPLNTIELNPGRYLSAGEAFTLVMNYERENPSDTNCPTTPKIPLIKNKPRLLSQRLHDFFHPQKNLSSEEYTQIKQKLEELEELRNNTGKRIIVSENPYLAKTPEFKTYQSKHAKAR
jgi:hypothetical protein